MAIHGKTHDLSMALVSTETMETAYDHQLDEGIWPQMVLEHGAELSFAVRTRILRGFLFWWIFFPEIWA